MRRKSFRAVLNSIAAGLLLFGVLPPASEAAGEPAPASVSKVEGTDQKRLTLLPEAAKRLDIQTAAVLEKRIGPTRRFSGEVVSISTDTRIAIVQVNLTTDDMGRVNRDEPATVLSLARSAKELRIPASRVRDPNAVGLFENRAIFYETSDAEHSLVTRELVLVEVPLTGVIGPRKVIPYAAVLYDAEGKTWVYTNSEPLVFVRRPISIETIVGDEVVLVDGPAPGTPVVTVGGAELQGAELGVGK